MARKQTKNQADVANGDVDGNVDKIREILFGGQMRDYEQRFADLEKRLTKNIEQLSSSLEKRLDRLDNYAKREIDKLAEQVKTERKARTDDGRKGAREIKELGQQVESWYAELEDHVESETRNLRTLLQEYNDELSAAMQDNYEQLNKNIDSEARNLADAKLARDDLAALFTEFGLRLKKDFKLPDA